MYSTKEITDKLKNNWEEIKRTIKNEFGITEISYKTWIDPLSVYSVSDNTVTILIPSDNSMALQYIINHYMDFIKVTISEFLEIMVDVSFILKKVHKGPTPMKKTLKSYKEKRIKHTINKYKKYLFI